MTWKLLLAAAFAISATPSAVAEGQAHWGYKGHGSANHWAQLDKSFVTCKLGRLQSPINIDTTAAQRTPDAKPIGFAYAAGTAEVINTGHTVQVNLPEGGSALIDGVDYKLLQFHFHTPSEEMINGKRFPLVAHLVHKNAQGELAVVAVLFKVGKENAVLKPVFDALPGKEGQSHKLDAAFDASGMLPPNRAFYAFLGSLTTPPCSEEVRWQVLKTPVEVSTAQLAAFRKLYRMNARPVQPLNGRKVVAVGG
ncbi:carbonic anhydrase family protein [Variovorax sp. J22R133]|uniref:carbonic anhydrase n=1 Tax=Variovorax brevis TaxID=3053503 RepID=UPI00257711BB|nr:carbonic anhydrase family protein [Variovorax sp. J22R133]MDM0117271.1 carbonic anhydrase family protein [Variovorax sp. J22R133]